MSENNQAERNDPVVVERSYRASVDDIWNLWATKEGFESWWGPEGFGVDVHVFEARKGGVLDYDMVAQAPDAIAAMKEMNQPSSHGTHGWYDAFRPTEHLSLLHTIDFLDGVAPYESRIDVDLQQLGEGTKMIVTLYPHPDPHWTQMSAAGFASQLKKLDARFGQIETSC